MMSRSYLLFVLFFGGLTLSIGQTNLEIVRQQHRQSLENYVRESENPLDPVTQDAVFNFLRELPAIINSARELSSSATLGNGECAPDLNISAESMMPSACLEDPNCQGCYGRAISNLTTIRRSLARLSCIYKNTKKFNEAAVSFGDNVSSIHGVMGLAWQNERKGIMDQFRKFEGTYDKKYLELMSALQKNLTTIGECENKFGLEDWYPKVGFIYFELMKEKYKR